VPDQAHLPKYRLDIHALVRFEPFEQSHNVIVGDKLLLGCVILEVSGEGLDRGFIVT
jgi:hypothetical protein